MAVGRRVVGRDGERIEMKSGAHASIGWIFGKWRGLEELEWTWTICSDGSSTGLIHLMQMELCMMRGADPDGRTSHWNLTKNLGVNISSSIERPS